jgi:hypothetical protein
MIFLSAFVAKTRSLASEMETIGALLLSENGKRILFVAREDLYGEEENWNALLTEALARGLKPRAIFDYWIERSNGVTLSVSMPLPIQATDEAALRVKIQSGLREGKWDRDNALEAFKPQPV